MTDDNRLTFGLINDVLDVLERHGYRERDNLHTGRAVVLIGDLASAYTGRDSNPAPESARPAAEAVVVTGTDVGSVVAALDLAADCKRDRAETCADCADRSCPACHSRLRDARVYDWIAAQMLGGGGAQAPGRREPRRLGDHDSGREIGQ